MVMTRALLFFLSVGLFACLCLFVHVDFITNLQFIVLNVEGVVLDDNFVEGSGTPKKPNPDVVERGNFIRISLFAN